MPIETLAATWALATACTNASGQNLARVEMQVAFTTLARRLPGLKLAVSPDELKFKEADIYGMKELPVSW